MMKKIKLSKRLQAIAAFVETEAKIADVGADHGKLSGYLLQQKIAQSVILTDIAENPLKAAKKNLQELSFGERLKYRLGDGLTVIKEGEVDHICIAGMGEQTILEILFKDKFVLDFSVKRLILQPTKNAVCLRRVLSRVGWSLIAEELTLEEGRYYETLVWEQGNSSYDLGMLYNGPILLQNKHPLLKGYLEQRKRWVENVLESLKTVQGSEKNSLYKKFLKEEKCLKAGIESL